MRPIIRAIGMTALLLCAGIAGAEPMTLRLGFALNGAPSELEAAIRQGVALQAKINPGLEHELWFPVAHGSSMAAAQLIVYYDNAQEYAETTMREEGNAEWNAFLAAFPNDKFPIVYTGIGSVLMRDSDFQIAKGGEVQVIIGFDVTGPMSDLIARVNAGTALQERINPGSTAMLVGSAFNGEAVDRTTLVVRHASIMDWAKAHTNSQASDEWREFVSQASDSFSIGYQGLSQAAKLQ